MTDQTPPSREQFELSVFGADSGESLVLHLGMGQWMVVDSCKDPETDEPAALAYLNTLGVDPSDVRLILATHWDDDHIAGLGDCVAASANATFGCSAAYVGKEFQALTLAYPPSIPKSGVREMLTCFDALKKRPVSSPGGRIPKRVIEDQTTWRREDDGVIVYALAPTSAALIRAEQDIVASLLPEAERRRSVGRITPNQASVVVTVRFSADAVLLGGDLEERGSAGSGWSAIVGRYPSSALKSSVFKIPHHGSDGAHHDGQWDRLINMTAPRIAVCTSFASRGLPRPRDLRRLLDHASAVYLTGGGQRTVQPELSRQEIRAMKDAGVKVIPSQALGHVRLRRDLVVDDSWEVAVSGNAREITTHDLEPPPEKTRRSGRRKKH